MKEYVGVVRAGLWEDISPTWVQDNQFVWTFTVLNCGRANGILH